MFTKETGNEKKLFEGYSFELNKENGILLAEKHIETQQIILPKKEILIVHNMDEVNKMFSEENFKQFVSTF